MYTCSYMAAALFLLLGGLLITDPAEARFGSDISTDNADNRFANMGQVTVKQWTVVDGEVDLKLKVEDTPGELEAWILDFQPYMHNDNEQWPVEDGWLWSNQTGECSSVHTSAKFYNFLNDTGFQSMTGTGGKSLFNNYTRGTLGNATRRADEVAYSGPLKTLLDCKSQNSSESVWNMTSTEDEVEFRTRLYVINVRPKDYYRPQRGVSFVQSHIDLIWRLYRTALAKVIISSSGLLRPVFEYAIVSTVYDVNGNPDWSMARLDLRFITITDSNTQMSVYVNASANYTAQNPANGLREVVSAPPVEPEQTPSCQLIPHYIDGGLQCHQVWDFTFILDIDTTSLVDGEPVDATGDFSFMYDSYTCEVTNGNVNRTNCTKDLVPTTKVSAEITIQTTVELTDAEADVITLHLHRMVGADNEDVSVSGRRGVAHLENVTVEVKFSPAFLRQDYELQLTLFMVCIGNVTEHPAGCLVAAPDDRYVAWKEPHLVFEYNGTTWRHDDFVSDYEQPLYSQGYVHESAENPTPVHRSQFTNLALSAQSAQYTITTVFYLVPKEGARRRRALPAKQFIMNKVLEPEDVQQSETALALPRTRRDIMDNINEPKSFVTAFSFSGCPANAEYDPRRRTCKCPCNMVYSSLTFTCEELEFPRSELEPSGTANIGASYILLFLSCALRFIQW
ncbi:Hypp4729 [Branchiostoma lanceolatum]|uniref:Hypp4729 protein n=1 Tax=Branchiostoma lanceolatum TaxID=7740 RepID=A0A8K0ABP1_BRALA|nr:Hypp4729 [Branchiostoma lanceolatum]